MTCIFSIGEMQKYNEKRFRKKFVKKKLGFLKKNAMKIKK